MGADRGQAAWLAAWLLPVKTWWLSFADPLRPKGQQFLGVAIVDAIGFIEAVKVTHLLGINPGGEVKGWPAPTGTAIPNGARYRLLQLDELTALGFRPAMEVPDRVRDAWRDWDSHDVATELIPWPPKESKG